MKDKSDDFEAVFSRLRSILLPYASKMIAVKDTPTDFYLDTACGTPGNKIPFFGSVQVGKGYVSFHLMPVYVTPTLLTGLSPGLKRRMQGKSCFNFKSVDAALFTELEQLTKNGFESYRQSGWV